MKKNQKIYLYSFLIALALTLLTALSVTSAVRRAAEAVLEFTADEALIETLQPLRYIRFRVSLLPTLIGSLVLSLPVWRIWVDKRTFMRIIWVLVILLLLNVVWVSSLLTLSISPVSLIRMISLLMGTLLG